MSRSTRTLIAIILFLLAGFIVINLLVSGSRLDEWLLPVILLGIALVLALYPEAETAAAPIEEPAVRPAQPLPATQPKPALEAGGSSQPAREPAPEPEPVTEPPVEADVREVAVDENPWRTTYDVPEPVAQVEDVPQTRAEVVDAGGTAAPATPDDLTIVEGIGKKMSAALVAAGIDTYAKLAASSEEEIRAAIQAAGMRFAPSVPTWANQAEYAARGDWEGLQAYKATLTSGRAT